MKLRYLLALLLVQGCMHRAEGQVDWDDINYAEVVCGKGYSNPKCKSKDDDGLAAIGRGKGK